MINKKTLGIKRHSWKRITVFGVRTFGIVKSFYFYDGPICPVHKTIDLHLNYFDHSIDMNDLMRKEFYEAKSYLFGLNYLEYFEVKSLPINPKQAHAFSPMATFRVKDRYGNYDWIDIFAKGFGGMLVINKSGWDLASKGVI